MVHEVNSSEEISLKPFNFSFVHENLIAVYQHGSTTIFDLGLNKLFEVPIFSNGRNDFITRLPNGGFSIFNQIYDLHGLLTKKKFKLSKKSLEKYNSNKFIDSNNNVIAGSIKSGIIAIYNKELVPINEIQLNKFEVLVHFSKTGNRAYTFNENSGFLSIYSYPDFTLEQEYQLDKLNNRFCVSIDGTKIFNYGYKPQNSFINLETKEVRKVMFHSTSKKGYKEQYRGPQNFGTHYLTANGDFTHIAACTHQNKAIIYEIERNELVDLELHKHFNYNEFDQQLGKYPFVNVSFEESRIIANVGNNLTVWDYLGNLQLRVENFGVVRMHKNGKIFCLKSERLVEIEIH